MFWEAYTFRHVVGYCGKVPAGVRAAVRDVVQSGVRAAVRDAVQSGVPSQRYVPSGVWVFGSLVIGYLFLGGAGCGALVALSVMACLPGTTDRFRIPGHVGTQDQQYVAAWSPTSGQRLSLPGDFFRRAWPLCTACIAAGVVCLVLDAGRPERLSNLLIYANASPVSVGAWALAVSLAVSVAFSYLTLFDHRPLPRAFSLVLGLAGVASGLVAAGYSGVLLTWLPSVAFWQTPLVSVVFTLSALSCGLALLFLAAAFTQTRQAILLPLTKLAQVDGLLILGEASALAALLLWGVWGSDASATSGPALALAAGDLAAPFWCGLVVLGLAVPVAMERRISFANMTPQLVWIGALVLLGGFLLRWLVVSSGAWDVTQISQVGWGMTGW